MTKTASRPDVYEFVMNEAEFERRAESNVAMFKDKIKLRNAGKGKAEVGVFWRWGQRAPGQRFFWRGWKGAGVHEEVVVLPRFALLCFALLCFALLCLALPDLALPCPCLASPYFALPCLVLPYHDIALV